MANTSLRSRLRRLFSTNVIVRRIGKKRLQVVDSNKLQSLGSMRGTKYIDRFSGMHTNQMGYNTYTDFWDIELSEKIKNFRGKMDLIYSSNTICHIQDLNNCFSAIDNILDDYGVFVFEDPSLLQILNRGSYDQFYDEHSHTFSIISLQNNINLSTK